MSRAVCLLGHDALGAGELLLVTVVENEADRIPVSLSRLSARVAPLVGQCVLSLRTRRNRLLVQKDERSVLVISAEHLESMNAETVADGPFQQRSRAGGYIAL